MKHYCPFCNERLSYGEVALFNICNFCKSPQYFVYDDNFYVSRSVGDYIWQIIYHAADKSYAVIHFKITEANIPKIELSIADAKDCPFEALKILDKIISMRSFT